MREVSVSMYEKEYIEMKMILRGIAHEMGNAMTLMGYSLKEFGKDESIKNNKNWSYLNEDFNYICKLFKSLSEYNNSHELKFEIIDIEKILAEVVDVFSEEYRNNGIDIVYEGLENAYVLADEVKLKQVYINIIKNAYEAIKNNRNIKAYKGKINVTIKLNEDKYEITISDNGCGIDNNNMCKIFEPMYTENKKGGTGFGLFVCKNIIESHNGTINVESQINKGTKFIIALKKEPESSLVKRKK